MSDSIPESHPKPADEWRLEPLGRIGFRSILMPTQPESAKKGSFDSVLDALADNKNGCIDTDAPADTAQSVDNSRIRAEQLRYRTQ